MTDQPATLDSYMDDVMQSRTSDMFYFYEPWEPEEPSPMLPTEGFQTAYHQSLKPIRMVVAGNRVGKTIAEGVEAVIMMTGELPFALRYPEGFVTDVPRPWEDLGQDSPGYLNRIRWGFIDPKTGGWQPPLKRPDMPRPDWPAEAPCGYILGAGRFQQEKISRRASDSVWICTYKETREKRWIPFLANLIPSQFLDTRYSADGYSRKYGQFPLTNGRSLAFITYEQGWERAQGAQVWAIFLDEEPKRRKFWTEIDQRTIAAGFDGWKSMNFTPLLGLSWSYTDLYQPVLQRSADHVALFHAAQYDSPYIDTKTIEQRRRLYKPWEISARIDGLYSEMQGKPYFDYEKLVGDASHPGWIHTFVPQAAQYRLVPVGSEGYLHEMLDRRVNRFGCDTLESDDAWEFYEDDVRPDGIYYIASDTAEGSENPDEQQDLNVSQVWRLPFETEPPDWPLLVAQLRTGLPTLQFARMTVYGAIYFNYATLVPEVRGQYGGAFITEVREYPFIYSSTVLNDRTRKPRSKWGFDTTASTRIACWEHVRDFIDGHTAPRTMRSPVFLRECAEAIYGKGGRPDHPDRGTSDCITAAGMALYVYFADRAKFRNNRNAFIRSHRQEPKNVFNVYHDRDAAPAMKTQPLGRRHAVARRPR